MPDEVRDEPKDEPKEASEITPAEATGVLKDADALNMRIIMARLEALEKRLEKEVDVKLPEELVMLADCVREETRRDIIPAKKRSWFYRELAHLKDEDE